MRYVSKSRELWESPFLDRVRGGDAYKKRRRTKRELVNEYYGKEEKMSLERGRGKKVRVICDDETSCCHGVVGELDEEMGFVYYDKPCLAGHIAGFLEYPPEKHYEIIKEVKVSPEIGTEVREGADDVKLNIPYEIVDVETDVETDVQRLSGVRVELLSVKGDVGNIMLWKRPVTGPKSKLGAFITLLGSNTDKWLHKWIIVRSIGARNNVLELTSAPEGTATKAKTGKGVAQAVKKTTAKS